MNLKFNISYKIIENILKDGNLEKSMAFLVIEYLYIYVDIYLKNIMVNVVNAVGEK